MLSKKKELKQAVVNVTFERIRLTTALESARELGDFDKVEDLKLMLKDLEDLSELQKPASSADLDLLAELNARNRENDLKESQLAEKAALTLKRQQGVNENDPFARRKTAPVHVVNNLKIEKPTKI